MSSRVSVMTSRSCSRIPPSTGLASSSVVVAAAAAGSASSSRRTFLRAANTSRASSLKDGANRTSMNWPLRTSANAWSTGALSAITPP